MISIATDFGSVELSAELRSAYEVLSDAADELQLTVGELADYLREAPVSCPCCDAEKRGPAPASREAPGSRVS